MYVFPTDTYPTDALHSRHSLPTAPSQHVVGQTKELLSDQLHQGPKQ